jgi:1-aminocyclopropane-1-carboxylate deaminase/D-cysteine desulfhydrase-like pyridoxal-dependent ACC family enzyme
MPDAPARPASNGAPLARYSLATLPTPLVEAPRLAHAVGGPEIYVKRDDLCGFGQAGHKARQLEFLIGAALDQGCDTIVTGGGPSSNFVAAAATAAATAGLSCHLVLFGTEPASAHPNLAVAQKCGAVVSYTGDAERSSVDRRVTEVAATLETKGRRPFVLPRGGATPLGVVGMVLAVAELAGQLDGAGIEPAAVVVATGSGGTGAGLALGAAAFTQSWRPVAASVSRPAEETAYQVRTLAAGCAHLLGIPAPARLPFDLVDARGPGFGLPSAEGEAAALLALRTEGLLLDPVYTAKALAVLLGRRPIGPVVFWLTGGLFDAAHHLGRDRR